MFFACQLVSVAIGATTLSCRREERRDERRDERDERVGPPSVEEALAGMPRDRPIRVVIESSEGAIHCELDPVRTTKTTAMFVGFATGRATWRDPQSNEIVRRPLYSDLSVFRAVAGAMMQSGCPLGDGTGTPGYRIPVESSADDRERLARPGVLFFARYNPPPDRADPHPPPPGDVIGSQFAIALQDMSHLAGQVTVIGTCSDLDVVRRITNVVATKERPVHIARIQPTP